MAKFQMRVLIDPNQANKTARIADGAGAVNQLGDADVGKLVRLIGDSQYGLTELGSDIEGVLATSSGVTQDGFILGGVDDHSRIEVTLNGLQATPGTGTVAVGDYVVSDAPVARGTKLTAPPAVVKATTPANSVIKFRVIAITTGAGAPGSVATIERI